MADLLPPWLFAPYAKLWKQHSTEQFTFAQATQLLAVKKQRALSEILSELRRAGWLTSKPDPENKRKRLFCLRQPSRILKELLNEYSK